MSDKKKPGKPFKIGDIVYFTAFLHEDPETFYVCQGEITKTPGEDRNSFRVRVKAIADRAIGKGKSDCQKVLIGRAMNKKGKELTRSLGLLAPKSWHK